MAGLIALLGVALILCVVAFPTPNDISVGEMAYQKLWLGRMTVVFAVCCLPFLCLNKKQYLSFPSIQHSVFLLLFFYSAVTLSFLVLMGCQIIHHITDGL